MGNKSKVNSLKEHVTKKLPSDAAVGSAHRRRSKSVQITQKGSDSHLGGKVAQCEKCMGKNTEKRVGSISRGIEEGHFLPDSFLHLGSLRVLNCVCWSRLAFLFPVSIAPMGDKIWPSFRAAQQLYSKGDESTDTKRRQKRLCVQGESSQVAVLRLMNRRVCMLYEIESSSELRYRLHYNVDDHSAATSGVPKNGYGSSCSVFSTQSSLPVSSDIDLITPSVRSTSLFCLAGVLQVYSKDAYQQ
ncbi:hypothetical protein B0H13DRAFT_1918502 [Mycena leptocephala]|nr:hypothetical protein B0H13DRAFT_1918502 [Mycena leptocephala]